MPVFYKLVKLEKGVTLEIDGVRMHQKNVLQDAINKVNELGVWKWSIVLDVCTGLGYSAIAASEKGASVITVEKDAQVLEIAKQNPDSKKLFNNPLIQIIHADAFTEISKFPGLAFDFVSHDPPRFSMAGELYSLEFYRQLFRVLKKGGRLFHYTGRPGEKSGKKMTKGIKERLSAAGFTRVNWIEGCKGFIALK